MFRRTLLPEYSGKSEPKGIRECLVSGREKLDRDHKEIRGPKESCFAHGEQPVMVPVLLFPVGSEGGTRRRHFLSYNGTCLPKSTVAQSQYAPLR